jgi:hypothetical protein
MLGHSKVAEPPNDNVRETGGEQQGRCQMATCSRARAGSEDKRRPRSPHMAGVLERCLGLPLSRLGRQRPVYRCQVGGDSNKGGPDIHAFA